MNEMIVAKLTDKQILQLAEYMMELIIKEKAQEGKTVIIGTGTILLN